MDQERGNLFGELPENQGKEVFETLLKNEQVLIERIVSYGQPTTEGEWYDQATDEWVLLAKGEATLLYENGDIQGLKAGDYVFIPRHQKHRVTSTSADAIWLAVHING